MKMLMRPVLWSSTSRVNRQVRQIQCSVISARERVVQELLDATKGTVNTVRRSEETCWTGEFGPEG